MPVIDYKCPNCGSGMRFDSATGKLSCVSCGRQDDIESNPDPLHVAVGQEVGQGQADEQRAYDEHDSKEYHCTSCGAVIVAEQETTATVCSFCGSAVVLADRLTGKLAPALVLPFAISKEQAIQAFRKWCRNGRLTPKGFMTADRIKNITGLYVPFWLYDLDNDVEAQGQATKVRSYSSGDYQVVETQHFEVYRRLKVNYLKVPIDAAEKMSDKLMDKLEPFPYNQLKDFKSPYLAGYDAEKYSYDDQTLLPRAKDKIKDYIDSYIHSTVSGYTSVSYTHKDIRTSVKQANFTLLPVWIVHYDYDKLEHMFAMNGQTGKVVGKPPISAAKVAAWFGGIAGVSFFGLKLISWMMGGGFW